MSQYYEDAKTRTRQIQRVARQMEIPAVKHHRWKSEAKEDHQLSPLKPLFAVHFAVSFADAVLLKCAYFCRKILLFSHPTFCNSGLQVQACIKNSTFLKQSMRQTQSMLMETETSHNCFLFTSHPCKWLGNLQ